MENKELDNRFVLRKPIEFDGEQITELTLDFDDLSSEDILSAERQYEAAVGRSQQVAPVKEFSKHYLAFVVARAAKRPVELIYKLSANDFSKISLLAQNFLLG